MAGTCGGQFNTSSITLDTGAAVQLVGTVETRTVTTIKADPMNAGAVFITAEKAQRGGYPLFPGEGYVLGADTNARGARAAVYAYALADDCRVYVIQEGA